MADRRSLTMRELILPIIISTIVGATSSYTATIVTLERLQTKLVYIEKDVNDFKDLLSTVNNNNILLSSRGVWMESVNSWKRSDDVWKEEMNTRVRVLEFNIHTKE